jgi:hypothetical protein
VFPALTWITLADGGGRSHPHEIALIRLNVNLGFEVGLMIAKALENGVTTIKIEQLDGFGIKLSADDPRSSRIIIARAHNRALHRNRLWGGP